MQYQTHIFLLSGVKKDMEKTIVEFIKCFARIHRGYISHLTELAVVIIVLDEKKR